MGPTASSLHQSQEPAQASSGSFAANLALLEAAAEDGHGDDVDDLCAECGLCGGRKRTAIVEVSLRADWRGTRPSGEPQRDLFAGTPFADGELEPAANVQRDGKCRAAAAPALRDRRTAAAAHARFTLAHIAGRLLARWVALLVREIILNAGVASCSSNTL